MEVDPLFSRFFIVLNKKESFFYKQLWELLSFIKLLLE